MKDKILSKMLIQKAFEIAKSVLNFQNLINWFVNFWGKRINFNFITNTKITSEYELNISCKNPKSLNLQDVAVAK